MAGRRDQLAGVLLGTAAGDALGLPREGLPPGRARALFGGAPLGHRLVFGRGMVSDDTEHACLGGAALLREPADPARFARALAWGLRLWLRGLPAGVGFATLRATLKLWVGFGPEHAGVFSAGKRAAERPPPLRGCPREGPPRLRALLRGPARPDPT